jgi:hypothetical protein
VNSVFYATGTGAAVLVSLVWTMSVSQSSEVSEEVAGTWATEVELSVAVALEESLAEVVLAEVLEFDSAKVTLLAVAVAVTLEANLDRVVLLAVTSTGFPSSSTLGT